MPDALSMTVHSLPSSGSPRRSLLQMWLVIAVCAAPVIASYYSFYVLKPHGSAYSELIQPAVELPAELPLRDLQGRPVAASSLKGQWLLITVQDGACDTACERMLFMQRQLRDMLGKERDKLDKLWLIPDDAPLRPELLKALDQGVAPTLLRVPREALQGWLKPETGHAYGEHLFLVDPLGRWMMRSPAAPDPSRFKKDLDRLIKANAGWDRPGR